MFAKNSAQYTLDVDLHPKVTEVLRVYVFPADLPINGDCGLLFLCHKLFAVIDSMYARHGCGAEAQTILDG